MGSAGLRALHIATAPEHSAHRAGQSHIEAGSTACAHTHGHACGSSRASAAHDRDAGSASRSAALGDAYSHPEHERPGSSHGVDCATCELLTTLTPDIALPGADATVAESAGDAACIGVEPRAIRTLAAVRARPPPVA